MQTSDRSDNLSQCSNGQTDRITKDIVDGIHVWTVGHDQGEKLKGITCGRTDLC